MPNPNLYFGLFYYNPFPSNNLPKPSIPLPNPTVPDTNTTLIESLLIRDTYDINNNKVGTATLKCNFTYSNSDPNKNTTDYFIEITVTFGNIKANYSYKYITELQRTTDIKITPYSITPIAYAFENIQTSQNYINDTNVVFKYGYDPSTNQIFEAFSFTLQLL
jgi:hypothetical protein